MLFATCEGRSIALPIDSIAVLVLISKGSFWKGAGAGFLLGGATGAIIGAVSYQKPTGPYSIDLGPGVAALGGGILGGAGGFLIGGIIGATSGHYETYDLRAEKTLRAKRRVLLQAF